MSCVNRPAAKALFAVMSSVKVKSPRFRSERINAVLSGTIVRDRQWKAITVPPLPSAEFTGGFAGAAKEPSVFDVIGLTQRGFGAIAMTLLQSIRWRLVPLP